MFKKVKKRMAMFLDKPRANFHAIRECPICKWSGLRFDTNWHPIKSRHDCVCPSCGSFERHRFLVHAMASRMEPDKNVFHVAPEKMIEKWIKKFSRSYVSGDIDASKAMQKEDLTSLSFDEGSFDYVLCSHVMEHIPADIAAFNEIHRVLKKGGVCIFQVPIWGEKTQEADGVMSDADREMKFFQKDHVRLYGLDIVKRLESCDFITETITVKDFNHLDVLKYGLSYTSTNEIFIARKT